MPRRILITGASGTVGAALLDQLLPDHRAGDVRLVAASRSSAQRQKFKTSGVDAVDLDFEDDASVRAALTDIDQLFLCTGYTVGMLVHSKVALDAARDAGVRHVVHLGALGPASSNLPHFVWHTYVEVYIERLGFQFTHLRPRAFMQNVLATLRPGSSVIRHFSGDARIAWIDVDDIARVAAAALREPARHGGKAYALAEDALTMAEVAGVLAAQSGQPFVAEARDPEQFLPALLKSGMDPAYAASLARGMVATARGDVPDAAAVYDTVLQVTGQPGIRWIDFARNHLHRLGSSYHGADAPPSLDLTRR